MGILLHYDSLAATTVHRLRPAVFSIAGLFFTLFKKWRKMDKKRVIIMVKKQKLKELIFKAQSGDKDALNQVVMRFKPIVKKYARRYGNEDIDSEITEWIIKATLSYKENITSSREELKKFLSDKKNDKNFKS